MATYSAGEAQVVIAPDLSQFRERVEAGLAAVDVDLEVALHPDMVAFAREMQARLEAIDAEIHVPVTPDLDGFAERVRLELTAIESEHNVTVRPVLDPSSATAINARLDELSADRTVNIRVDQQGGAASLAGIGAAADRSRTAALALNAVKFSALIAAAGAAVAAIGGIAGIAGGAATALGAIGAAGVVGFQGIGGAFSAMKKASDDAGDAAKQSAKDQEAAADRVREAQQGVKDAIVDQQQAQERLQDAQETAKQKQDALNDAYKDASRYLQDMNDRLRDAELSQESAAISLARAQERQAQLAADGKASALDRAEADLNVRQAQSRLDSSRKSTARQQQDTGEANSKGLEGTDQVQSARDGLNNAYDGVVQAQRTADAAARQVTDSQRELSRALRDQAQAATSAGGSADEFAKALAKLSPNARQFVLAMQALGPQMAAFKNAVQDRLFDGLGQSVTTFVQTNLPMLQAGLGQVAGYMNGAFKQTLSQLSSTLRTLSSDGTFSQLGVAIQSALSGVAPLINGVVVGFSRMGAEMGTTLGPLFASLGQAIATIGGPLGQLGAFTGQALTSLMPVLSQFIGVLAQGLGPIMPVLSQLLQTLGSALIPIIPTLSGFIVSFGQAFNALLAALAPLLPPLFQLASAILTPLVGIIRTVADAMAPFIVQLAQQLSPVIAALTPILMQVGQILGQALAQNIRTLMPVFMQLVQAGLQLLQAVMPLLPPLAQLTASLMPLFAQVLAAVLPPMLQFTTEAVIPLVRWLADHLAPIVAKVADFFRENMPVAIAIMHSAFSSGGEVIEKVWNSVIKPVFDFLSRAFSGMSDAAGKSWDFVKGVFGDLGKGFDALGRIADRVGQVMRRAFDGVVDLMKQPIHFLGGLLAKVPSTVFGVKVEGLDQMKQWGQSLQALRGGGQVDLVPNSGAAVVDGRVTGPGTGISDSILGVNPLGIPTALVSNEEFVVNADATRKNLSLLQLINSGKLQALAGGGIVGGLQFATPEAGKPYQYGGTGNPSWDCSGFMSGIYATIVGKDPRSRHFNTESDFGALGFLPGDGPSDGFSVRIHHGGGGPNSHMAGKVGGKDVESSGSAGVTVGPVITPLSYFEDRQHLNPALYGGVGKSATPEAPLVDNLGNSTSGDLNTLAGLATSGAKAPPAAAAPTVPEGAATDGVGTTNDVQEVATAGAATSQNPMAKLLGSGSGSLGDLFGNVAKGFISGQIDDAMKTVLGTSDMPGIVKFGTTIASSVKRTDSATTAATATPTAAAPALAQPATAATTPTPSKSTGVTDELLNTIANSKAPPSPTEAAGAPGGAKIAYNPAGGVEQWRPLVVQILAAKGQDVGLADKVLRRMNQESSGNPKAQNNTDSNAAKGTPSKSLMQVIDPTFQAYKDSGYDDIWDPEANIRASMNYAMDRYGSLQAAYDRAGGYADGGSLRLKQVIPKPQMPRPASAGAMPGLRTPTGGQALAAPSATRPGPIQGPGGPRGDGIPLWGSAGEYVVNAVSAQANRGLLDGLNRDANFVNNSQVSAPTAAPHQQAAPQQTVMSGRGGNTYVFQVSSVDEALAKVRVEDARSSLGLLSN